MAWSMSRLLGILALSASVLQVNGDEDNHIVSLTGRSESSPLSIAMHCQYIHCQHIHYNQITPRHPMHPINRSTSQAMTSQCG